jgi:hypothetical protein
MSSVESAPATWIFMSYARSDALPVAFTMRQALEAAGLKVLEPGEAESGRYTAPDLEPMMLRADAAVILITPDALKSTAMADEVRWLQNRAARDRDFRVAPVLVGDVSRDQLAGSSLEWLASRIMPQGSTTEERVAAAAAQLGRSYLPSLGTLPETPGESAAESSFEAAESAIPTPTERTPSPPMSQSTRNVVSSAGRRAGDGPVDASVVLVSALYYARETSLPGVTSALLAELTDHDSTAEGWLARLDAVLAAAGRSAAHDRPFADLAATPPLSGLLALAAGCAQRVSGKREIHLRHLVAAAVLADDPPLRPELMAELGVTRAELRRIVREAAQQGTTGESHEAWEALLPAVPLRLLGGIDTDRVDPNRGIPLSQDDLGFGVWAKMFAHIIAGDDTPMPLSIGIFGAWGAGKSYFMGLLRSEIDRFSASGLPGYLRRIEPIVFNAWHYADANLWASLGDEIFRQLAERKEGAEETREHLRRELAEGQAERRDLQARTAQAKQETARLEAELRKATAQRQLRAGDLLAAVANSDELRKQLNPVWRRLGVSDEATQAKMLADEIRGIPQDSRALRGLLGQRRTWVLAAICLIALLVTVAAVWIPAGWAGRLRDGGAASTVALVLTFGLALLGSVRNGLSRLSAVAADLSRGAKSAADQRTKEDIGVKLDSLQQAEADEKVTSAQLEQVTARVGELARELADLMPGQRLYTFLAERSASGAYTSQLGLVSTIRKDFELLVELLDDWRKKGDHEHGRHGIDRIVLYIDDLDRCGPRQVVEVLQAVHLLLALDLFVVVVGVDPRWLTRSLRHQFPSTLDSSAEQDAEHRDLAEATPADYLEKIFNIPFVLPAIPKDGLGQLMRRLAVIPEDRAGEAGETPGGAPAAAEPAPETAPSIEEHSEIARASSETAEEDARPLTKEELDFLAGLEPFISTPRDAKRMFNLYRMLRSTRDLSAAAAFLGGRRQPGEYQAVATLLAMLTADARLLHYVLDAPPPFRAPPREKVLVAGGLTCRPSPDRWHDFVDDLKPERGEDGWENRIIGQIPDREVRGWQRLADAAASTRAQISLPDLSVFQRWAPSIRRFSYMLSPLNDPEG